MTDVGRDHVGELLSLRDAKRITAPQSSHQRLENQ